MAQLCGDIEFKDAIDLGELSYASGASTSFPGRLIVKNSQLHGLGVFVDSPEGYAKNANIIMLKGNIVTKSSQGQSTKKKLYSYELSDEYPLLTMQMLNNNECNLVKFINASSSTRRPNATIYHTKHVYFVTAKKQIAFGEELIVAYNF